MTNLEFLGGNRSNKNLHLFGGPLVETDDATLEDGVVGGDAPAGSESGGGKLEENGGGSGGGCTDPKTCGEP